jgi:hypothetical protein
VVSAWKERDESWRAPAAASKHKAIPTRQNGEVVETFCIKIFLSCASKASSAVNASAFPHCFRHLKPNCLPVRFTSILIIVEIGLKSRTPTQSIMIISTNYYFLGFFAIASLLVVECELVTECCA